MPNRKSPKGYALNFLRKSALYDQPTKEQLNQTSPKEFTCALQESFPGLNVDSVLQNLPASALTYGLVLKNRHGQGALQQAGQPPKPLKGVEWSEQMRLQAYQKNGVL